MAAVDGPPPLLLVGCWEEAEEEEEEEAQTSQDLFLPFSSRHTTGFEMDSGDEGTTTCPTIRYEHSSFYTSSSRTGSWLDLLSVWFFRVEGQLEFCALLFGLRRAPFDLFMATQQPSCTSLAFFTDDSDQLIPVCCILWWCR